MLGKAVYMTGILGLVSQVCLDGLECQLSTVQARRAARRLGCSVY